MTLHRRALALGIATITLAACQSEPAPSAAPAAVTPTAAAERAAAAGDACDRWLGEVKAMCTAFVEGREVAGDCMQHSITVRTSFEQPEMQNPAVGPAVCNTHLQKMTRDQGESTRLPAVTLGEECTAFAAQLKRDCVDSLGAPADTMACHAKLSLIATARGTDEEQRESACAMGRMLQ
jgi:hypothetical protein